MLKESVYVTLAFFCFLRTTAKSFRSQLSLLDQYAQQLAQAPWPVFGRDLNHSRFSSYLGSQVNLTKWTYVVGDAIKTSPAYDSYGTIYFGASDKNLYALNANGSLKFSFKVGAAILSSPALSGDGTIYFGSDDKKMYAINSNGALRWSFQALRMIRTSPTLYAGNVFFGASGTNDAGNEVSKIYAVSASDGTFIWSYPSGTGGIDIGISDIAINSQVQHMPTIH